MAGGRSSRMRATLGPRHKALVAVLGTSLLERNLSSLFAQGFADVTIAVSASEPELGKWFETHGLALAREHAASVRLFIEDEPLGTIGAAGALDIAEDDLLVVNVDNLTAIDLRTFVSGHRAADAAMTIAVHEEEFEVPFGVVRVEDASVVDYTEKPRQRILISSGTYVLGSLARSVIEPDRRTNVPELVAALRSRQMRVATYEHVAPWIDINDARTLERAEAMIARDAGIFDRARRAP